MIIVVEGPDNSGKSTLIEALSHMTGLPIVAGEGPPKSTEEINDRVKRYLALDNCIFDRHPCVSNAIYDAHREIHMPVDPDLIKAFYDQNPLFIYCVGTDDLGTHVLKDHDTEEHQRLVEDNASMIVEAYNLWAFDHANWLYRKGITDAKNLAFMIDRIMRWHEGVSSDMVGDVAAFHHKFGLPQQREVVGMLSRDDARFRTGFMREELKEYEDASKALDDLRSHVARFGPSNLEDAYVEGLANQLDALVDLIYVAIGTALFHGFDLREAWRRVQAANMAKMRAKADGSDSKRGSANDVVKPEGWKAPSHIELVANNDFETLVK